MSYKILQACLRKPIQKLMFCVLFFLLNSACTNYEGQYSGYVEGEFVFVASAYAGHLTSLSVQRGDSVDPKQQLFTLDAEPELYQMNQATETLRSMEYKLENLIKPRRPDEIASIEAQKEQAIAQRELSKIEFERSKKLIVNGAISQEQYDESRSLYEQNVALVEKLDADLRLAHLGARQDEIEEARANAEGAKVALSEAQWKLDQKTGFAPNAAIVQDTFYRVGEWIGSGLPVVSLLPPENMRARFFVPETDLGKIKIGQAVKIKCDGCAQAIPAKISFISQAAEFTVPLIYSQESRSKLVFLVEAKVPPEYALSLHPGQPISIFVEFK